MDIIMGVSRKEGEELGKSLLAQIHDENATMAMANVVAAAVASAAAGGTDTGGGAVVGGASKTSGGSGDETDAREYSVSISDAALGLKLRLRPPGKRAGSARVHDLAQVSAVRKAGVKRGDVLLEINGSSMRGLRGLGQAVKAIKDSSRPISLKFRRPREGADPDESDDEGDTGADGDDNDPPLKDDPVYAKYWKMLKVGLPLGAVMNACERDSVDPTVMELDPNKSLASQRKKAKDNSKAGDEEEEEADSGPALKDDPIYGKYWKMLKVGLPKGAVKNALARDGLDQGIIDLDPEKSLASQQKKEKKKKDTGPPLKDDPTYQKYFKMLKVGLPVGAVKNALSRDGLDPGIMDLDPDRPLKSQQGGGDDEEEDEADTGPALKDDPVYAKYFKMLKVGLPIGAVKNACTRDNVDPSIIDYDPEKSLKSQQGKSSSAASAKKKEKKPKVRRKKLYWTPIDEKKIEKDSLWSIVRGSINMSQLKYDASEFEDLFTDKLDKKKVKSPTAAGGTGATGGGGPKKSVQVIDGKRGMNGGIILSRIKMEYSEIAKLVDMMENRKKFDTTQLKALKEFLPTDEEAQALKGYLAKASTSEEVKAKAMADLCACEQYMVAMLEVPNAAAKFDCMLFKTLFQSRLDEIMIEIKRLNDASEEVRSSERLRKLMAIILTVGNQINTGGEGNSQAAGFSLDALLKLEEAKAFDKRTSVLFYLVKLIKVNDEGLLKFTEDIPTVPEVSGQMVDSLFGDLKQLSKELEEIQKTADVEADRLRDENGKFINYSRKKTLTELQSQKTSVHKNEEGVEQFNLMESEEEVTEMQFFAMNAKKTMDESYATAEEMKSNYLALLRYFGEDEKMPSGDFFATLNRFLESFDSALDAVNKAEQARIKEEKRQKAKEMKEKMRSTMKKGAAAIQQATKNPPSLQDILKKKNASGAGEEKNEGGEEIASKPTLAGAAAAALAKTKTKARESMEKIQKNASKGDISSDFGSKGNVEGNDKPAQNPRLALMNSLRKKAPTPSGEGDASASTSASTVSTDPRAALLGAIRSKSKAAAGGAKNGEEEITFVEGAEPSLEGDKDDDSTKPSPILDPRAAMLAAIKKKKNNKGVSDSAPERGDAKQTSTTDDPRSAVLNAIKSKKNAVGVATDHKDNASPELACIANRNLRSRSRGDSESQENKNGGDTTKSTVEGDAEARTNQVDHGDAMAKGLVLTKSEANLVLENLGDDESVERGPDSAEGTRTKKQMELSDSVATQMAQTDTLLEEFDKSLARLDTREADLSRSYNNDDSDDEDNCGNEVVAAGEALDDLASELARAEVEMLGQNNTSSASEDIDTSAVAQAAAAKALAKRKQASSDDNPRATMLAAISSRKKSDEEEAKEVSSAPAQGLHDPKAAMLQAISSREKADHEEGKEETTPTTPSPAPTPAPVDPRSAMLAAITSRKQPDEKKTEAEAELTPAPAATSLDPRSAMLAAISLHKRPDEAASSPAPAPAPVDPRSAMLVAITSRKQPDEETAPSPAPSPSTVDPRSAMLAAISSRKQPDEKECKKETTPSPTPSPAPSPIDPRSAMLAAITSRAKPEDDKTNEVTSSLPSIVADSSSQSVDAGGGSTDPRTSMLSAILSRKGDSPGSETKEEEEGMAQDPRAGVLASIQARRVD